MSLRKFLAFDLGAASGRAIIAAIANGNIALEEVHRFPTRQVTVDGHLRWDLPYLFDELKNGLARAVERGHGDIESVGIDTWGVDFGLIGKDGLLLDLPYAYRDHRTDGMMEKVFERMSGEEIYSSTGIQMMQINSLYQLFAMSRSNPELLESCDKLLFMPDLLVYLLTGEKHSEYTIASTSQMLNAKERRWEEKIFSRLNLPVEIMPPIVYPGKVIGTILPGIVNEVGLKKDVKVVAVGSHDTASAIAAVPVAGENWAYLSSGTWSLVGVESESPIIRSDLMNEFTNEGGVGGKITFLKNVTGLWLLQETQRNWKEKGEEYSFNQLVKMARVSSGVGSIVDPDDPSFLNPPDMPSAIKAYCRNAGARVPESNGEIVRCIFDSLAAKYDSVLAKIGELTGRRVDVLHILGGGSQNELLNQLTADACGIPVMAGPSEATALGNVMVQAIAAGEVDSVARGRELVASSFPSRRFSPAAPR